MQLTFKVIERVFDLTYTNHNEFADERHNRTFNGKNGATQPKTD